MIRIYTVIILTPILFSAVIGLAGCSSSTYSSRYERDSTKDESGANQRFSDENDVAALSDSLSEDDDEIPEDPGIDITSVVNRLDNNNSVNDVEADRSTLKEKMLI